MTKTTIPLPDATPKPLVITFGNLKGGVGKTTSAFFLACYFAIDLELRVLYIDADPLSQTGYAWHRRLKTGGVEVPFELVAFPSSHVDDCVKDNAAKFDVIIVDVGGESPEIFKSAVTVSNELVLVAGVTPSEVNRIPPTFKAAEEAASSAATPIDVNVRVLLTKVPTVVRNGKNISAEYRTQRANLEDAGYDVFESFLSAWKWYREAADGKLHEGAENPIEDRAEYAAVAQELLDSYRETQGEEVSA